MSELCILGIDPGLSGAIAFLFPSALNRVLAEEMPVVNGEVDAVTLADRIRQMSPTFAIVERVHNMPRDGGSSSFKFGDSCGAVRGVLGALVVPFYRVTPPVWKKHFNLPADKEAARALALQRFPVTGFHFARKKDHGRAEAALIALYAHEMEICV